MEIEMAEHGIGNTDSPFAGHGEELLNVKFFRGTRNDVITVAEMNAQARSAAMQVRLKTATMSPLAPVSSHPRINVGEFVAAL